MVRSSINLYVHLKSMILGTLMAGFTAAVLVIVAHAQDPYPTWVCSPGYYWRHAFPGDQVCVTASRYWQVQDDNSRAKDHIDEESSIGALSGGEGCLAPYVWREAGPNDHVCVTQQAHDDAIDDNLHKDERLDYRYHYPRWANGTYRLDFCLEWGYGCGQPAAEEFCHYRMWTGARNYVEDSNIGASQPTQGMHFESGQVCREGFCNGFQYITCYGKLLRASESSTSYNASVYSNPNWKGYHLDECYFWDSSCGKIVADLFCRQNEPVKGFTKSLYYRLDAEQSTADTMTIGTNEICAENCRGFQIIICQ